MLEEDCSLEEIAPLLQPELVQARGQTEHHKLQPGQLSWLKKFLSGNSLWEKSVNLFVFVMSVNTLNNSTGIPEALIQFYKDSR